MPTRTEAMQALYDAADDLYVEVGNNPLARVNHGIHEALGRALDAYSTSTPDPLPAEVQRVVEAAVSWWEATRDDYFSDSLCRELRLAVRAYRSTQPEPLSARLARLKPGSVVTRGGGDSRTFSVIANDGAYLWTQPDRSDGRLTLPYAAVSAIISESP